MVDLNPLHYVNKFNHMFGDTVASGLEFLGITDPAVDPDGVREIAKKWRHLATGLDDAAEAARKAMAEVEWEGKAAEAFHKRSKAARKQATEMADALREGAKALDDFADQAHELLTEIGVLLAEIAEFEIAGLALSVLTGGASAVVSSLMAGSRAVKVVALVARIEKEGTTLASVIRTVMETIRGIERALKALKEIRGVASVAKMAKGGAEFAAFDTLLKDPAAFKDPEKLAGILTEGALLGIGFGVLGKALGKGLKAIKPADLAKLSKGLKLDCAAFERLKLNPGFNKLPASVRNMVKKFVRDPIDVATGDMALPRVDVQLPGVLPLILERTHLSSYRFGGWFGPSWASTLDQRLQADGEGFVFAAADGARLCFPLLAPDSNEPVRPQTPGSRLALSWDDETDGALRITDPDSGLIHVFHSPVAAADDTAVDLPLQHIQDRNGNRITVVYAEGDIPAAVVHSGGYHVAIDHDPARSRITGLRLLDPTRPDGRGTTLLTFGYDEHGRLTEEINSSGLPMRYTYDADGRITSWTDRNNTTYWYAYDDRGRVVATGGTGDALASTLAYDDATRTTRVTDSLGHMRIYEHNEALRLVRETDPLGNVTVQEWDEDLQLISVTNPLGHTTRYEYDENGRTVSVTRPDDRAIRVEYNGLGLPTSVIEADGTEWHQEYDERGNLTAVTDPTGAVTSSAYDAAGRLTKVVDALGHTTRIHSNSAGLAEYVTDPLGATTRYARDAFGRPVAFTDPLGNTTRLERTVEGRLVRRTAPDGNTESWTYDGEGNCVSHIDALGAVSHFEYTCFDLLSARTDPDGVRHEFAYDTELRLTKATNAQGLTWTYEYDAVGNLVAETDFDGRTRTYEYDAAGLLKRRTDVLDQTVTFDRDALGQVVRKDAAGQVTAYTYDPAGQLMQAMGPETTLTLVRDTLGRVHSETVNSRTVAYAYDGLGRRTSRTTPSGAQSTWTYDAAGNRTQMVAAGRSIDFAYDQAGRELSRHLGGTLGLTHTYDLLGRLTGQSMTAPGGRVVQHRAYTYRADGNLVEVDDQLSGTRRFDLDMAGRVTAVRATDWAEAYTYDEAGNQTSAAWPTAHPGQAAMGERTYEGTRITRAGNVRYEHDALGRVVLRQKIRLSRKPDTWRYEWDVEDRLTQVTTPDGTRWRYTYDPLGRRTAKLRLARDGETLVERVDFAWDGKTLCEQTTTSPDLPNPVTLTWDHQGLRPISQTERITVADAPQDEIDSRFFAIITDLVGAPSELVDEHGDIAWRARSTLWGTTAWAAGSTTYTPLRFPGQYYDPETGLHYNHFRYYDPEAARYLTTDPLGLAPAPNPAGYVKNPHAWSDPLGLAPEACTEGEHLFRGTTRGFDASGGAQTSGYTPTSTDPGVATTFARHSEQFGEAVVQVIPRSALEGVALERGYIAAEAEVAVGLPASELTRRASVQLPVDTARAILADMGIHVPKVKTYEGISDALEWDVAKLSPEQIKKFVAEAYKHA
ncbi:RHS repeat-associated core domain-containing protein [Streptomyces justiciae]|uniref:RHS repeat-associated core domain-containing protein n=1 Tax=Streptomyces justiciae TaxID=2780140 RepID=A0ABU3M658_9ACTN|nr:RHS repeat-associated core domain-containing protein [Streptomyces justiciae]MDT7846995.1 RHS repeat-associated core domain-containing protein [Streptomyces justiciae]